MNKIQTDELDLKSELYHWSQQTLSQYIIKKIRDKLENQKEELTKGTLVVSKELEREYCYAISEISTYKSVLELLETGEWDE